MQPQQRKPMRLIEDSCPDREDPLEVPAGELAGLAAKHVEQRRVCQLDGPVIAEREKAARRGIQHLIDAGLAPV